MLEIEICRAAADHWDGRPILTHNDIARWINNQYNLLVDWRWVYEHVKPLRRAK